jgi:GNAT superfamily N-acetyltransferase
MQTPSIREFLAEHQDFFEKHEAKFNILLGLALQVRKHPRLARTYRLFSFGRPGAAALQAEGRNIVLGDLGPEDCAKLASHYSNLAYPGLVAPDQVGDWFVQAAGAGHFGPPVDQGIFQLDGRPKKPPAPGAHAPAADTYLVIKWLRAFHLEADGVAPEHDDLFQRAEHGRFFFWNVDGAAVAMAGVVREGLRGATIGAVYTLPVLRGHRFGEAVTAAVAEEILKGGKAFSSLYADLANPAALRIYERIGFRLVCHSKAYRKKA